MPSGRTEASIPQATDPKAVQQIREPIGNSPDQRRITVLDV